jgi:hypothetical protein
MLPEAELVAGPENAAQLTERAGRVRDAAQHQRDDRRIEVWVGERQPVGDGVDHAHGHGGRARRRQRPPAQVALGLDGQHLAHLRRVVGKVEAVAGAELDHPAGEPGQQLATVPHDVRRLRAPAQAREPRMADLGGHRASHSTG